MKLSVSMFVVMQFLCAMAASVYMVLLGSGILPVVWWFTLAAGGGVMWIAISAFQRHQRMAVEHAELTAAREALHRQATVDQLTGLLNRSAFHETFANLEQDDIGQIALLFFDLDKFKDINDTLGHRAGDLVLSEVAHRCSPILKDAFAFARLGGDEFAAIIKDDSNHRPEAVGQEIVDALSDPLIIDGKVVNFAASVGIAIGSLKTEGIDELLRRADFAMYEAKGSQRGACQIFDDVLDNRQTMDSSIRVALGQSSLQNDLTLVYQPLIDARSGDMASVEALLRWRSDELGEVSPSTLIPIAEASGHIEQLTEWTLDRAFETIRTLGDVGVAVNISPVYFKHPEFVHRLFDRLIAAKIPPHLLTLEITEGVLISNIERAQAAITRLRGIGVKIFLDDFGTGYSSLSYLQHFALDGLKLDKPFLRNVGEKRQATQIIRTMINFGHSLDMKVVVEGVETEWNIRLLQLLGCDLLQGYAVGVPMKLDELQIFRQNLAAKILSEEHKNQPEVAHSLELLNFGQGG